MTFLKHTSGIFLNSQIHKYKMFIGVPSFLSNHFHGASHEFLFTALHCTLQANHTFQFHYRFLFHLITIFHRNKISNSFMSIVTKCTKKQRTVKLNDSFPYTYLAKQTFQIHISDTLCDKDPQGKSQRVPSLQAKSMNT